MTKYMVEVVQRTFYRVTAPDRDKAMEIALEWASDGSEPNDAVVNGQGGIEVVDAEEMNDAWQRLPAQGDDCSNDPVDLCKLILDNKLLATVDMHGAPFHSVRRFSWHTRREGVLIFWLDPVGLDDDLVRPMPMPVRYKVKFEAPHDLERFVKAADLDTTTIKLPEHNVAAFDCIYTLSKIRKMLQSLPNCHVMEETVEREEDYTGIHRRAGGR